MKIECRNCSKECYSGKRGLCNVCYSKDLKVKAKIRRKKKAVDKQLNKAEMLKVMQKLARVLDPPYCCTCDRPFNSSLQKQGGHGIKASKAMSTALLLRNIHGQCSYCNLFLSGNTYYYGKFVNKKYGEGTFEYLNDISNIVWKPGKEDLRNLREKALEYISLSEDSTTEELEELRKKFMDWQESQDWFIKLTSRLKKDE